MTKLTGAYKSLVRGVSEQVPQDRLEGQHWEQVNMISDPIKGLCRRRGSIQKAARKIATSRPSQETFDDFNQYKEYSFHYSGIEYSLLYRNKARTGYDLGDNEILLYNKDRGAFLEVRATDAVKKLYGDGFSSVTTVGQYLLLASKTRVPAYVDVDNIAKTAGKHSIWVKSGEFSRTYTATVWVHDKPYSASYTTMKSYYDKALDTSDIKVLDDQGEPRKTYQKEVNDRVNAYNGAVNQHLAAATLDRQPQSIAQKLSSALISKIGVITPPVGYSIWVSDSHILLDSASFTSVTGDDGGDGTALVITSNTVSSLAKLTKQHYIGKTVKVSITDSDPYYVKALPSVSEEQDWGDVIWREAPGIEHQPTYLFVMGIIRKGTLYLGSTPEDLQKFLDEQVKGEDKVPVYQKSSAGDNNTCPVPSLFKHPIDFLGVIQQRLIVVSGATVMLSRSGDFFNFFRKSVLTIPDDDPIEMESIGSEDDHIRAALTLDRNFVMFGDRQQYMLSGREVLTPKSAYMAVMSSFEGATDAVPVSLGNQVFFTQYRGGRTQVMQMQTGQFSDTFDAFSISPQLSAYIKERPVQILAASNPQNVIVRTEGNRYGFYVYAFLDAPGAQQRYWDSWSRWEWDACLGSLVGMSLNDSDILVYTLRESKDGWFVVVDEFSRESDSNGVPVLDSGINSSDFRDKVLEQDKDKYYAVVAGDHKRQYVGRPLSKVKEILEDPTVQSKDVWTGVPPAAYFDPTAPYRRDQNNVAILDGRMTLASLLISVANTGPFAVDLYRSAQDTAVRRILNQTSWRLNDSRSLLGRVSVRDGQYRVVIGREIREHRLRISAVGWFPFSLTTIEWQAQVFSNRR